MMISGVTGSSSYWEQMAAMQAEKKSRTNPFEENDANGDGFLNVEELGTFVSKMSEMTGQEADAQEMLSRLDTDGDGQLSEEEFEAGRPEGPPSGPPPGPPPEMMGGASGTGIESLLTLLSSSEETSSQSFTDALDLNGDGTVDAEELITGLNKLIQAYGQQNGTDIYGDSNATGSVDIQV